MVNDGNVLYEMDYVYIPDGCNSFKSVHVILEMPGDDLNVYLISDDDISKKDLVGIIFSLQKNKFDKLRIDMQHDLKYFLKKNTETFSVKTYDGQVEITGPIA